MKGVRRGRVAIVAALGTSVLLAAGADAATKQVDGSVEGGFDPKSITIRPGDTVRWVSADNAFHTATADGGAFDEPFNALQSGSHTFRNPGTYTYFCEVHGRASMSGTVVVRPVTTTTRPPTTTTTAPPITSTTAPDTTTSVEDTTTTSSTTTSTLTDDSTTTIPTIGDDQASDTTFAALTVVDEDGGPSGTTVALAMLTIGALSAGAGGYVLWRRRQLLQTSEAAR